MMRTTTALLGVALVVALSAGACSSGQPEAQDGPTVRSVSEECRQAFADVPTDSAALAGDIAPTDPASPLPTEVSGAFVDLYGTVTACGSVDEWTEAYRGQQLAMTRNADPISALRTLCQSADDEQIRSDPVCQDVQLPDAVSDTTDNDADLEATESPGG